MKEFQEKNDMIEILCQEFKSTRNENERKEITVKVRKLASEVKALQREIQKRYRTSARAWALYQEENNS